MRIDHASELIRLAREDIGMSQSDLARAAKMQQPTISAYESGRRRPRPETLERILKAAKTRPSLTLEIFSDDIVDAARRNHLRDVRVFGSSVRGTDNEDSDIDLLVALTPETSLFDLGGFVAEVEAMTGFSVDVMTDDQLENEHFAHVLDQAVPL
jgi:uncharacterized protein